MPQLQICFTESLGRTNTCRVHTGGMGWQQQGLRVAVKGERENKSLQ